MKEEYETNQKLYTAKDLSDAYTEGFKEGYKTGHKEGMTDEYKRVTALYTLIIKDGDVYSG